MKAHQTLWMHRWQQPRWPKVSRLAAAVYDHMQQHTGQHLLSAVLEELFADPHGKLSSRSTDVVQTIDVEAFLARPRKQLERAEEALRGGLSLKLVPCQITFEDASASPGTAQSLGAYRHTADRHRSTNLGSQRLRRDTCKNNGGDWPDIHPASWRGFAAITRLEFVCGNRALRSAGPGGLPPTGRPSGELYRFRPSRGPSLMAPG